MKRKKLRQLAKQINNEKEVIINFVFAPDDHFCYLSKNNSLEISSFYYRLSPQDLHVYLVHEIGHMNTLPDKDAYYTSNYTAEYEANRWALYRLDELNWTSTSGWYEQYLHEMSGLEVTDEDDEEYQEAATDLLLELGLT